MQVRSRVASLAAVLPLARALSNGALRPRHRELLAAAAGCELRPEEPSCTLRRLLEAGAVAHQVSKSSGSYRRLTVCDGQRSFQTDSLIRCK